MIEFPQWFFHLLVLASLAGAFVGVVFMIRLWLKDNRDKVLW